MGLFVTGTDTGVGKTVVSGALLSRLLAGGVDAVPMKPVQTGCRDPFTDGDLAVVLAAGGLSPLPGERGWMCPYCFEPACSPHFAAARVGERIEMVRLLDAFRALQGRHDCVVVEGAGGVLVPLGADTLMTDLMAALGIPALVVARSGVGTLNHTLMTVQSLQRACVPVLGVVLNDLLEQAPDEAVVQDNRRTIELLGGVPVLGRIPAMSNLDSDGGGAESSWAAVAAVLPPAADLLEGMQARCR